MVKPKLNNKFKERTEDVEVKLGFKKALEVTYTNEELNAIYEGWEQVDEANDGKGDEDYYIVDEKDNIVACLVRTLIEDEDNKNDPNNAKISEATEKALARQGVPSELWQQVNWSCKCKAAPGNLLRLRLSEDQFGELEMDTPYIFIGLLQKQWSKKLSDGSYENKLEATEGYFEGHTLSLIDTIK